MLEMLPDLDERHGRRRASVPAAMSVAARGPEVNVDAIPVPLDADRSHEPLRTAKGIVTGLALSSALWGVIAAVAFTFWS